MADQADGSIIIDTEINSDGFKAGSAELLAAIKALSTEVKNLGQTLKELFSKPLTPEINTGGAEDKVAALEAQVHELETAMEELRNAGPTGETAGPQVNMGGTTQKASELQREIDAVNTSVERLEPTFQKAMSGSESAMATFEGKASTLQGKIAELQERLDRVGQTKYPTQEYEAICAEAEKAKQKFDALLDRQEKMQALGVNENSAQWKSLQYDMELVSNKYHELIAQKQQFEASGSAFQMGADTSQYAQMEATLSAANARLQEMRAGTSQSEGIMRRLASAAGRVASFIGRAAASAAGALVSGIKSAASHMAKMLTHSKSMKGQFSGLISSAKKFTLSLLGARGVYALLRKAVSAYMAQNQQLANTLSSCWSGIGNLLGPIITRLINLVAQAVAYVTSFLKLFGLFSSSAKSAISSAGGAASKETDKLKRQLAAFDELNILSDNSSDGGGGGGGAGDLGSLPDVTLPDWAKLMVEQIKAGDWAAAAKTLTDQFNTMVASVDWAGIGDTIGYYLNGALTFLATAITTFDWYNLGASLGELINHIIYGVDWANLGIVLGWKFIALIEGLGGLFATIDWAALGKALADAFMGLWNAIDWVQAAKTLSDGLIGALNSLSTAIKNVDWQKLGNDVATFIANIDWGGITTALFDGIGAALGGLAAFIWGLIEDAWNSVVDWWYDVAYDDGGFTMEGLLQGIWDGICNIGTWIKEHIFQPFIDGFKSAFGIASPSTVMAEQGDFIVQGLLQGITDAWHTIVGFFSDALASIIGTVTEAWESIKSFTSETWENIKSGVSAVWGSIKSTASSTWNNLKATVSNGWNSIKATTSNVWSNVKSSLSGTWSSIKSTASSTWGNMKSTLSRSWSSIKSTTSSTWSSIKSSLSSTWGSIKSTASSTWGNMKSTLSRSWSSIKSTTSSTWSSIKSSLSGTWSSIKSTASSTWSGIKSTIQNQGWSSVGSNITSGIKNGISEGWSTLTNWVSQKAESLLGAAKSALGIHSPSRLFRDQVGLNIGLGIGEGIEDSESSVLKSVTGVADAIAAEVNDGSYTLKSVVPVTEVNGAITSFTDKITDSFTSMLERLQAIAENVTFTTPAVANGVVPYRVTPTGTIGGDNVSSTIEASNDELASVVTQVVSNATASIVTAIQTYSGPTVNIDKNSLTETIIKEINRRTRMAGKSPLVD